MFTSPLPAFIAAADPHERTGASDWQTHWSPADLPAEQDAALRSSAVHQR
jgi:hypothetical protein